MSQQLASEVLILEPGRRDRHYWADLWRHRELLYLLAKRDISVRYKQTVMGVAWAVVRPLVTMLVFTLVFGKIARLPSDGAPYSLLVFAGLVPWFLFASAFAEASNSLIANSPLVSKTYFPRLLVPMAAVVVSLVDFVIGLVLLLLMATWMGHPPTLRLLTIPVFVVLTFGAALGLGFWFSALNVTYRDFQHLVPFILQFGLYASPIGFAAGLVPPGWRLVYDLNPMVGVIDGFRWAILGGSFDFPVRPLVFTACATVALLLSGTWFFRRTERSFADVI